MTTFQSLASSTLTGEFANCLPMDSVRFPDLPPCLKRGECKTGVHRQPGGRLDMRIIFLVMPCCCGLTLVGS